ncbi:MAG: hypothetical protein IPM66_01220 [Acidobacteriota bacterium]|nr:MAG: hypothetical protein IPM66_01220 [Acidobacteriota bacterium]
MEKTEKTHKGMAAGILISAIWVMSYFAARFLLRNEELDQWVRVGVALFPIIPFAGFLWAVIDRIGGLDEMQRRVHLEALAIAFPLAMLMLMTLGLLELAIDLSPEDWSYRHVWAYLPLFYFMGLAIRWRRYR